MREMASTIVGGSIALVATVLTQLMIDRLNRRNQRTILEREALIEWVSAFEEWMSIYNDYAGLVLGMPSSPNDAWKSKFLERMEEAHKAGRRLDVSKYRVLLVECRDWVREVVMRLTKASEVRHQTSSTDPRAQALAFRGTADKLRADLEKFLRRLAGAPSNQIQ